MTDSCATCRWARWAPARVNLDSPLYYSGALEAPPPIERRLCVRMPAAVVNDATYCCGEYAMPKGTAS